MPKRTRAYVHKPTAKTRVKGKKLPPGMEAKKWQPGDVPNPKGAAPGMKMMTRIREILKERSLKDDGRYNTRFDDAADAYVRAMESGSFIHLKEFIDREEGKVPTRMANADGTNIKMYSTEMPTDGEEAP